MDLKTTYGERSVRSTGPSAPAEGGGGGGGELDDLLQRVMRNRLTKLLGGGRRGRAEVNVGPNLTRGGRATYHGPLAGGGAGRDMSTVLGGGGSAARNAKRRDQYETDILGAQAKLARASARAVPKKYVNPGGMGGAYLVDDWDNVALGLRPNTAVMG